MLLVRHLVYSILSISFYLITLFNFVSNFTSRVLFYMLGVKDAEGVWEHGVKENILKDEVTGNGGECITRS